ncbi:uncharacterized protein LODBEIA_P04060 [Lodderomyces beijingensis]|uniref:Cyclin N-terminal domain-containing protein n=1 Tax=Lodderomyces beijingensis TaxID=1775926 RepID=A0ABP0ZJ24_9ASCO
MSDKEALKVFSRQLVSMEMIAFLVATTESIIQIKPTSGKAQLINNTAISIKPVNKQIVSLTTFIKNLIKHSNVQTPTLMATLVYLNKLRNFLPANAVGMETTRHRIFLSALILAAKNLNDCSPLNKHWTQYTNGLLTIDEVNLAERELIGILKWDVRIRQDDLYIILQPFLKDIKLKLQQRQQVDSLEKLNFYRLHPQVKSASSGMSGRIFSPSSYQVSGSSASAFKSSANSSSSNSSNSLHSNLSLKNSNSSSTISSDYNDNYNDDDHYHHQHHQHHYHYHNQKSHIPRRMPLSNKSLNNLNHEQYYNNYVTASNTSTKAPPPPSSYSCHPEIHHQSSHSYTSSTNQIPQAKIPHKRSMRSMMNGLISS